MVDGLTRAKNDEENGRDLYQTRGDSSDDRKRLIKCYQFFASTAAILAPRTLALQPIEGILAKPPREVASMQLRRVPFSPRRPGVCPRARSEPRAELKWTLPR